MSDKRPSMPQQPAHMFTNARNVNINSGDYNNVNGAVINARGPGNDPSAMKDLQKSLRETRKRYGSNTNVSSFEGFSGNIHRAGKVQNIGGGRFSVHNAKADSNKSSKTAQAQPLSPPSPPLKLPPTRYEATMFNGATVDNLEFDNLSNIGMADLAGLDLSPEDTAKLFEAIMATNQEYASSMTATMFNGTKSRDVKIRSAVNVAGAALSKR